MFLIARDAPAFPSSATIERHLALCGCDGLPAYGGNLRAATLLDAYRQGFFPFPHEVENDIERDIERDSSPRHDAPRALPWHCPEPRMTLATDALHIGRSFAKTLRRAAWTASLNRAFERVIAACSEREETWITADLRRAFVALHKLGHAHSVEVFDADRNLIGGLYGVGIGRMFFGESMFARRADASKVALFYLCRLLRPHFLPLIDCQMYSPHLERLGARPMPRALFLKFCAGLCAMPAPAGLWRPQDLRA